MSKIILDNMEFHAYHGVMEHETALGNTFLITVVMDIDTEKAAFTDHIEDTVNYKLIYQAIKKQMEIPSQLIEHAAKRILDKLMNKFPRILQLELYFSKLNPPLEGKVERVTIVMEQSRK